MSQSIVTGNSLGFSFFGLALSFCLMPSDILSIVTFKSAGAGATAKLDMHF